MRSPMRDKNEGTYRGGEGTTCVTTACPEIAEGNTSYELNWKVKGMIITKQKEPPVRPTCIWMTPSNEYICWGEGVLRLDPP